MSKCKGCGTEELVAMGIGPYCPNDDCEWLDGPPVEYELFSSGGKRHLVTAMTLLRAVDKLKKDGYTNITMRKENERKASFQKM